MKARERLLLIADRLDALAAATIFAGGCMPEDAAALRVLADRLDEEFQASRDHLFGNNAIRRELLYRLDAPLQEDKT